MMDREDSRMTVRWNISPLKLRHTGLPSKHQLRCQHTHTPPHCLAPLAFLKLPSSTKLSISIMHYITAFTHVSENTSPLQHARHCMMTTCMLSVITQRYSGKLPISYLCGAFTAMTQEMLPAVLQPRHRCQLASDASLTEITTFVH